MYPEHPLLVAAPILISFLLLIVAGVISFFSWPEGPCLSPGNASLSQDYIWDNNTTHLEEASRLTQISFVVNLLMVGLSVLLGALSLCCCCFQVRTRQLVFIILLAVLFVPLSPLLTVGLFIEGAYCKIVYLVVAFQSLASSAVLVLMCLMACCRMKLHSGTRQYSIEVKKVSEILAVNSVSNIELAACSISLATFISILLVIETPPVFHWSQLVCSLCAVMVVSAKSLLILVRIQYIFTYQQLHTRKSTSLLFVPSILLNGILTVMNIYALILVKDIGYMFALSLVSVFLTFFSTALVIMWYVHSCKHSPTIVSDQKDEEMECMLQK